MIEKILASNKIDGWYQYLKTYYSYLLFKKFLEENILDTTKKEKCYLLYEIGICSTYIFFISIFCIILILIVTGTI